MDKQKLMNAALAGLLGVSLVALPEEVEGSSSTEELSTMLAGGGCGGGKGGCNSQRQAGRQIADNSDYQRQGGSCAGKTDDMGNHQRQGGGCAGKTADTSNRPRQGGGCAGKSGGTCAGKTGDMPMHQRPGSNSNSNRANNPANNANQANANAQRNAASQRQNTWGNPISAAEESPMNKGFDDSTMVPANSSDQMAQPRRGDSMSGSMSKPNMNMSKGATGSSSGMSTMPGVDTGAAPSKGPGSMTGK